MSGKAEDVKLDDLKQGTLAVIARITGGRGVLVQMSSLGLYEGKKIRVVQTAPFKGPILVEDVLTGARTMIGRKIASHVEISSEEP
jgi:Fe2+ transport system protein FeoA